jgi:glucose/arabinose dehydrogenase
MFQRLSTRPRLWLAGIGLAFSLTATAIGQQPAAIGFKPLTLSEPSYTFETAEQPKIRVTPLVRGLPHPFSVAFLPNGDALVAVRGSHLRIVRNVTGENGRAPVLDPEPVGGIAQITPPLRNGGLHDIVLHPKFAENGFVYFTYNTPGPTVPSADPKRPPQRQTAITVVRGRFDGKALAEVEQLFIGEWEAPSGSRMAFAPDGTLYVTSGAPFNDKAQKLDNAYGKVLRIRDDGSIPPDNPFVGKPNVRGEVYSYGHRDQLGLTVHPMTGAVLNAEHGPNGGDEVNVIGPGRNYGWPTYSFGRNYDGSPLAETPIGSGIEAPIVIWLPSIAPTGMTFYTGDRFPAWRGNLFIGSARQGEVPGTGGLERVVFNDQLGELRRETLLTPLHQRIRDVRQGPDGLLYVLTDEDDGALLRIEPVQ